LISKKKRHEGLEAPRKKGGNGERIYASGGTIPHEIYTYNLYYPTLHPSASNSCLTGLAK
jgi:hypothetical protein